MDVEINALCKATVACDYSAVCLLGFREQRSIKKICYKTTTSNVFAVRLHILLAGFSSRSLLVDPRIDRTEHILLAGFSSRSLLVGPRTDRTEQ